MSTDLEDAGLATTKLDSCSRDWLITVDFEAFSPADLSPWLTAMREWAMCAHRTGLRFAIFIALEDVATLRAADPTGYARFLAATRAMHSAGCVFHPHNHQIFEDETGARPRHVNPGDDRAPGYRKRTSFYFEAVHREGLELRSWLRSLGASHRRFLLEAEIPPPHGLAFRAGGWDTGSTVAELRDYVESLGALGYTYDSSASAGEYGTRGWRVGAHYGENIFCLRGGVLEVAATNALDCGASWRGPGARTTLANCRPLTARPRPGVLVTVLHFDHIFHRHTRRGLRTFAIRDEATIARRVRAHFRTLVLLRHLIRVDRVVEFAELALVEAGARV